MTHVSSLQLRPITVEYLTDPARSEVILADVRRHWTAMGQMHPHWSVLVEDRFSPIRLQQEEFYETGADDFAWIKLTLLRNGLDYGDFKRVTEYGCGVGRVTAYLAGDADKTITAIDISRNHMALAAQRVASLGLKARFVLADVPEFGMTEEFDFWFSRIVLQHNAPPVIYMILDRMFEKLASGGVALFQLPTHHDGYEFRIERHIAQMSAYSSGQMEMHCLPQKAVFEVAAKHGCIPLEVRDDNSAGINTPWSSTVFVFRKP